MFTTIVRIRGEDGHWRVYDGVRVDNYAHKYRVLKLRLIDGRTMKIQLSNNDRMEIEYKK